MTDRQLPLRGINLPWFDGAYGHDMAPNERLATWPVSFAPMKAYRALNGGLPSREDLAKISRSTPATRGFSIARFP